MTTPTPTPHPKPPVRTQADLERVWRDLMEPLGFADHALWVMLLDAGDRPLPALTEIGGTEEHPTAVHADGFATCFSLVLANHDDADRVALLMVRPGGGGPSGHDLQWAHQLYAACRRHGLRTEVIHLATDLATDDTLCPIPLDALLVA